MIIPENSPVFMKNYLETQIGISTWDEYLSGPALGFDFLSYRVPFWAVGELLNLNVTQLVVIERIVFQFVGFSGAFFLVRDYLLRLSVQRDKTFIVIASAIAASFYGVNPSFMIGDSFWPGIEFAFLSFPWIIWAFNKVLIDRNWKFIFVTAVLLSMNISEHFWTTAYPILLFLYSVSVVVVQSFRERRLVTYPLLSYGLLLLTFVALISYRLIAKLNIVTPYAVSQTKLGVDFDWQDGTILNMIRTLTHFDLKFIYQTIDPLFSFLNDLYGLTILIPLVAFLALIFYRRNWFVSFYSLLMTIAILPFFQSSPLKWIHYWIFFETPFGPAFRSWRIPEAFISISLAVLIGFSLYYILSKCSSPKSRIFSKYIKFAVMSFIIVGMMFIQVIYAWPLYTGNVNGMLKPVDLPAEYIDVHSFILQQEGNARVAYIPDFLYSYGGESTLKPFWSPEKGAIEEFLIYPVAKPALSPAGWYSHYYYYSLSPRFPSLLSTGDYETLARVLDWANIKFVVVHDDIETISAETRTYLDGFLGSSDFRLVFNKDFMYVFENLRTNEKFSISGDIILVDGGQRAAGNFIKENDALVDFTFLDQRQQQDLENYDTIITDKQAGQLLDDLIFSQLKDSQTFFLYDHVLEHNPSTKWSRASLLDPHQNEWHQYIREIQDYSWDHDYGKGLAFTINSNDSINISTQVNNPGTYLVMIRYFANEIGGAFTVDVGSESFQVNSVSDYNGFLWFETPIAIDDDNVTLSISNNDGFNALSVINIVPVEQYEETRGMIMQSLSNKTIISLNRDISSSFEENTDGWTMDLHDNPAFFDIGLDNDNHYDGTSSLRITSYATPEVWSWMRSDWIEVSPGEQYQVTTRMKGENTVGSHIVLEAYVEEENRSFQLGQVPHDGYGTFDWRTTTKTFTIPENVSRIRLDLNAGWPEEGKSSATTWFDNITLVQSADGIVFSGYAGPSANNAQIISQEKLQPTLWRIGVNADEPFILSFAEAYNENWVARIDDQIIRSQNLNGVANGFWIDRSGKSDIEIEYTSQQSYNYGVLISMLTIAAWLVFIFNTSVKRLLPIEKRSLMTSRSIASISINRTFARLKTLLRLTRQ